MVLIGLNWTVAPPKVEKWEYKPSNSLMGKHFCISKKTDCTGKNTDFTSKSG